MKDVIRRTQISKGRDLVLVGGNPFSTTRGDSGYSVVICYEDGGMVGEVFLTMEDAVAAFKLAQVVHAGSVGR